MAQDAATSITFGGSDTTSVSAGGSTTSDTIQATNGALQSTVQVKADNNGTPASGHTVEFVFIYSVGDVDGGGGDDFTTEQHSTSVILDTNDEDPASALVQIAVPIKAIRLIVNNNAGNGVTVSALLREQT